MYVIFNYQCSQQWIFYTLIIPQICLSIANSCPFTFTLWIISNFRMNKWKPSIIFLSDCDLRNAPPSNTKKHKSKEKTEFKLHNNLCITLNLNNPDCCFSLTKQQVLYIQSTSFFCAVCLVALDTWYELRLKNQQILCPIAKTMNQNRKWFHKWRSSKDITFQFINIYEKSHLIESAFFVNLWWKPLLWGCSGFTFFCSYKLPS